jgi:hypothetical protein
MCQEMTDPLEVPPAFWSLYINMSLQMPDLLFQFFTGSSCSAKCRLSVFIQRVDFIDLDTIFSFPVTLLLQLLAA